ncbi:hypothetical protein BKM70_13530 [Listeria monocytogenes]|nr:hypothetical protein BKM70_13530 [Listeria monocytogenes]
MLVGNNIAKSYPNKLVLQNVDFEAKPGDMIVLTGENGSGKIFCVRNILIFQFKPKSGNTMENTVDIFFTADIFQDVFC